MIFIKHNEIVINLSQTASIKKGYSQITFYFQNKYCEEFNFDTAQACNEKWEIILANIKSDNIRSNK